MRALGISRELWIVVLLVGCSDVQDSDIDGDGIADEEDACQASFADEVVDFDGDGKDATLDLCPHDKIAASGDLDRDGIPDACDPFFDDSKRDTRQCITSFGVRWMNASYLKTRAGELPFDLAPPLRATAADDVSTVSALALDFPSVSFDVVGELTLTATGSFQFWLRAGEQPTNRDVACGIDAANNLYVLAAGVQQAPRPITHPLDGRRYERDRALPADDRRRNGVDVLRGRAVCRQLGLRLEARRPPHRLDGHRYQRCACILSIFLTLTLRVRRCHRAEAAL
jgi:hypothetical protein